MTVPMDHGSSTRARGAVLATVLLALVFLAGIFVVPAIEARGVPGANLPRLLYAPLCHQNPSRSLTLDAHPLTVCSRCTGLYLGGAAGLLVALAYVFGRRKAPRPFWLAVAIAPTIVDAVLPRFGLPALSNVPRLLLAVPAGLLAGVFLAIGIYDLFQIRRTAAVREPAGSGYGPGGS
jgi:uncharacterized membrane protein